VKYRLFTFLLLFFINAAVAQQPSTTINDSLPLPVVQPPVNKYVQALQQLHTQNKYLNTEATPVAVPVKFKKAVVNDSFFYLLLALVFLFGLFRFFYSRYFNTLFRVFFNTSLRQNQLTDQLLQSKLPSLLFNVFFILSAGAYIYFLLRHYQALQGNSWLFAGASVLLLAAVYVVKYSTLKFTGWITGYSGVTDIYVFVVFLISKIIGVLLLPFTIIIAFADFKIAAAAAVLSLLITGLMLIMRFLRSYGLLQNQLKITRFHFLLYLAGVEIIPLLLIYKLAVILLHKNL
jgi:Domain of unknown function (DUF4271)